MYESGWGWVETCAVDVIPKWPSSVSNRTMGSCRGVAYIATRTHGLTEGLVMSYGLKILANSETKRWYRQPNNTSGIAYWINTTFYLFSSFGILSYLTCFFFPPVFLFDLEILIFKWKPIRFLVLLKLRLRFDVRFHLVLFRTSIFLETLHYYTTISLSNLIRIWTNLTNYNDNSVKHETI